MFDNEAMESSLKKGYYKGHQVDLDYGELSLSLVEILYSAYQNAINRFPHCYVYRFRLRIPKKQSAQEKTLLNQWFYRFCHYRKNDNLNVIWKREVNQTGCISYRITLFLDASNYPPLINEFKLRKRLTKDIKSSWRKTTNVQKHNIDALCLFSSQPLFELNSEYEDYKRQRGFLFFVLSRHASSNGISNFVKEDTLGSFISKSRRPKRDIASTLGKSWPIEGNNHNEQ
ncbi:TPA: inovirus-type Gp2 protein [Vibrio parahaemolyticus]|uniref:YagK/YfjJ domain-containing protein n=1 Tax=Vibrio parahaemolyticus TaxID=670 RepID=UPI001E4224CD|nr:inovirus-type Gp2 protein [Vibrio parahaemolyticus]HCE2128183.1 inovirus-type Gp2 protein [Vibrio parahaemolyticus]HCE3220891.1 inovirus-type Gp2 protein [Vibrio parahaemolyticus]HCM1038599.1 inovirus-type Gp2 protein [Vibrio parahaemolyticus]